MLQMLLKDFYSFQSYAKLASRKTISKNLIINYLKKHDKSFVNSKKIFFSEHHLSHAASAFYPSPYDEAIILTADGVGEWATTTVGVGKKNKLEIKKENSFSSFTWAFIFSFYILYRL